MWEPDEAIFEAYCTRVDISDLIKDNRLVLVIGDDESFLEDTLEKYISDNNAFHSNVMAYGKYADKTNEYVKTLVEIVSRVASEATQEGFARKKFHMLPCNNLLYTIHTFNDNYIVSQLFEAIPTRDIPVIIVAAGPSLMKNCKELKRAKGKAIIAAVSHSAKTLFQAGISPDFVAISDATATDFLEFDKNKQYTLLSSVFADKGCRKEYNGNIIYHGFNMVNHLFMCNRSLTESYSELDTGSVATDVFSLFISAGFKRIILVGQDLAYDENGYTHTGFFTESNPHIEDIPRFETEGIFGGMVKTRDDWDRFRRYFECKIKENVDLDVIDATEGGALIHGTKVMPLSEVVDRYCCTSYPIENWMSSLEKGDAEEAEFIDLWFDTLVYNIREVHMNLKDAVNLNRAISAKWDNPSLWNDAFRAMCKKYDVLYSQIMEGNKSDVLRLYCIEAIQNYLENALAVEGDDNTQQRMLMEYNMFMLLREKSEELLNYINDLRGNPGE